MNLSSLVLPVLLAAVAVYGLGKGTDVYGALTHGAEEGLRVLLRVLPALVGLLTAVNMFRASGAMECFSALCAPLMDRLGIPPETAPLMLIRPVSGSGALAVASDLMSAHGPDSYVGRVAAVMLGSTAHRSRRPGGGPDGIPGLRPGGTAVFWIATGGTYGPA